MRPSSRSRWSVRDMLALAVVALCAFVVLAALLRPGAGFEPLLLPIVRAVLGACNTILKTTVICGWNSHPAASASSPIFRSASATRASVSSRRIPTRS
jgi:hypothetical protein